MDYSGGATGLAVTGGTLTAFGMPIEQALIVSVALVAVGLFAAFSRRIFRRGKNADQAS